MILTAGCAKKKVTAATPPAPVPATASTPAPRSTPTPAPVERATAPTAATPASHYPDAPTRARIDQLLAKIEDAYFDYDKATLRPDATKALNADSTELRDILKDYPDYKLMIEGHADERGSAEYNVALGDRRAATAKEYLVQVGIPATQLDVTSYGKERPACQDHNENCWQKNRRIHIVAEAKAQ
ncbi:MAG TPA: OmpA family protein [Candidatus Solibacter sp.]